MRSTFVSTGKRILCGLLGSLLCLSCLLITGTAILSVSALGKGKVTIARPALELSLGEKDVIVPQYKSVTDHPPVTFKSGDSSIVTVDNDGNVEAKKVGSTTITMSCAKTGDVVELPVTVVEKEHSFDENIMITTFWPPNPGNMVNDEQYKLLADAGITQVLGAGAGMDNPMLQEQMLLLCDKYGMGLTLGGYFGNWVADWTEEETEKYVALYRNVPAAYGFHMIDEPYTGNSYVNAYLNLRKYAPNAYCHLNFLPSSVYDSVDTYKSILTDYVRLVGAGGDKVEYLVYDRYPFGATPGSFDHNGFFENLRAMYEVGLKEDVKTGTYIQTVGIPGAMRSPEDSEIRYEMYASLAFGYKQLAFFTWFTPQGQSQQFFDGIIKPNGKPNSHYYAIKDINHEILALGPTLVKCDALEIYLSSKKNDSTIYGQPTIPSDFFVQVNNDTNQSKAIVSLMRHRETGRNYLMVVNNNFSKAASIELTFASEITSISEVSRKDGSLVPLTLNGSKLTLDMAAGDGILLALPEDVDYYDAPEGQPEASVNLGADALMYASSSVGSNGCFIAALNDGSAFTPEGKAAYIWRSTDASDNYINIDLGRTLDFDRVDLYGVGGAFNYGEAFPANIKVSVSDDGKSWKEVKKVTGVELTQNRAYMLDLGAQTARWLRLDFTDIQNSFGYVALNEIEIYNDRGRLPDPEEIPFFSNGYGPVEYKDGENIALGKQAFASSATDEEFKKLYGWSLDYLNDGKPSTGWTTNVRRHDQPDATEYVGVFFGDLFAVEKLVIHPKGCYPEDFIVELSADCKNWTKVYEIKGSEPENGKKVLTIEPETPVPAMYVRLTATKLRADTGGNGYMFQLGELEAYGRPVCDKSLLEAAMATFEAEGGDKNDAAYTEATAALSNEFLTSTQMKALMGTLYTMIGRNPDGSEIPVETEPETEPVTDPVTDPETVTETPTEALTETNADVTEGTAATELPATEPDSAAQTEKGCKSAIPAGTLALTALVGAALSIRRKKENGEA